MLFLGDYAKKKTKKENIFNALTGPANGLWKKLAVA